MPSIRIGFGTDFNLISSSVGIGSTLPTERLDVRGQVRADNSAGSGGVSTITRYDGFLGRTQVIGNNLSIGQTTKGNLNSLSGEIVIASGKEITVSAGTSIAAGRLDSLTVTGTFDLPEGGTSQREATPEKGSTRFNIDLGTIEFYTGVDWRPVNYYSDGGGRGRGVIMGTGGGTQTIEYVTIATLGNSSYFGDQTFAGAYRSASSSSTRGIYATGYNSPVGVNNIDYVTLASQGNSISFGQATQARYGAMSVSSQTRGVFAGGYNPAPLATYVNTIDYIQIDTLGNATSFGSLTTAKAFAGGCSSPTRGLYSSIQFVSTNAAEKSIVSITISTTGNAVDFGNLTERREVGSAAVSNGTRAVFASGSIRSESSGFGGLSNRIDYVTISTFGNATYFGDLATVRWHMCSVQSLTRGVFAAGATPSATNNIEYITIVSTGNAQSFGNLSKGGRSHQGGASDSHGGLGGF